MHAAPIILPYQGIWPTIDPTAFIAPGAVIVGDVVIGPETNIWFGVVIRGDVAPIRIGARTNIQDGSVVHVTRNIGPTAIGDGITVGHKALLHACTLSDGCFVGMGATVMDFAVVETGAFVAAGALVTPKKQVKAGEMWAGNPAKFFRHVSAEEAAFIPVSAAHYVTLGQQYRAEAASR